MKIQVGEVPIGIIDGSNTVIYSNKTRRYLLPCLKEYGDEFMLRLNKAFKRAAGIDDMVVYNCGIKHETHLFILLDASISTTYFNSFIGWIRDQSIYEDDYVYGNIQKSTYHMVVIKFPEKYDQSFTIFKTGKYSQMYDPETIVRFFDPYPSVKSVLTSDKKYIPIFIDEINKVYGTNYKLSEWEGGELDFPPTDETEIFNHHLKHLA